MPTLTPTPTVEQWRGLVSRHFKPGDVDKALWVMGYESGGDPSASGDGGSSVGLFQLNDDGLGSGLSQAEREDPEANVRAAAAAVYGGQGWKPWGGDGNTYKGRAFGSLGNHPYPGDGPSGLLSASGGTYNDGTSLIGRNPLPEGISPPDEPSGPNYGGFVQTLQDLQDAIQAEPLDRADFGEGLDGDEDFRFAQESQVESLARLGELQKLFADYQNGIANLGEYQVPIADMPPQLRAQLDAYNAELFKNIQNEFTLTGFDLEQSAAIAQYNAQLQEFSSNLGRERLDQAAAGSALDRSLAGLQESRQRADLITSTFGSDYVRKYGVPTGSTGAFTAGELGGASAGLAAFVGRGPDEVGIRYPGTAVLDPEGLLASYDKQFGVSGALPDAYSPSLINVPEAPQLPTVPSLLNPQNPTVAPVGSPPGAASGVQQPGPPSAWERARAGPDSTDPSAPGARCQGPSILEIARRQKEIERQGR